MILSLNISNTSCTFDSGLTTLTFVPISKIYVLSGATKPNQTITFVFKSVFTLFEQTTQFSGKLNIRGQLSTGSLFCLNQISSGFLQISTKI